MPTTLLEKALKSAGGLGEFKRRKDQFGRDLAYVDTNRDKLLEIYNEKWIAVYQSELISHGKNYHNVLAEVKRKGLPEEQVVIKFLSSREVITLYPKR